MPKSEQSSPSALPRHIAIVMDGNGRWAKKRLLPKKAGHSAGAQALKRLALEMNEGGFEFLTVYVFSTENWKRSEEEVGDLMNLLREYFKQYIKDAEGGTIRWGVIGDPSKLDADLQKSVAYLTDITKDKTGLRISLAINYGGRDEMVRAVRKIAETVQGGGLSPHEIDEGLITDSLDTAGLPDPDIILRTGGDRRLSNFLLWQGSYSELFFSDKLWPDFKPGDLAEIVREYQKRERRFGGR